MQVPPPPPLGITTSLGRRLACSILVLGFTGVGAVPVLTNVGQRRDVSTSTHSLAKAAADCVLTVPKGALSAAGMSTPWFVKGCDQFATPTFVDCTILDTSTGNLFVYYPLVVNDRDVAGTDFIPPTNVSSSVPEHSAVVCHLGTNGESLKLVDTDGGSSLREADCVNGMAGGDIFGQFAACGARSFWAAVRAASSKISVPPLGTARSGRPCYTTRSFAVVDMDPSDNCLASYLADVHGGVLAQNTPDNYRTLASRTGGKQPPTELHNGSDHRLLAIALDGALGCTPFLVRDLTDPSGASRRGSAALNELHAAVHQSDPVALVPSHDPMALSDGSTPSTAKLNLYRAQVYQPPVGLDSDARAYQTRFCALFTQAARAIVLDAPYTVNRPSPEPEAAKDLFTFLGQRHMESHAALGCDGDAPVTVAARRDGVAVALAFDEGLLAQPLKECGMSPDGGELNVPPTCAQ